MGYIDETWGAYRDRLTTGQKFEEDNAKIFINYCANGKDYTQHLPYSQIKNNNKLLKQQMLCDKKDKEEGTDLEIDGLRIDLTTNFDNKDYMPFITDTNIPICDNLYDETFKIGIRHGNSHKGYTAFPEPVIVIGFNIDNNRLYEQNADEISKCIAKNIDEIIGISLDIYDEYHVQSKKEFDELYSKPLKPNPRYIPPRTKTNTRYEGIDNFVKNLIENDNDEYNDYIP